MSESELFGPIVAAGPVRELTGDASWLAALLETEAALAMAESDAGVLDRGDAEAIASACTAGDFDVTAIGEAATGVGNPAAPLVGALRDRVPESVAGSVHLGATSQDIVDTAAMLVASRCAGAILADLAACSSAIAGIAEEHAGTVQIGRTLLQQAVPTTFGLTAAGWLSGTDRAVATLSSARDGLAGQLGGPTGTLSTLGSRGLGVLAAFCERLGLSEPDLPWHTERSRVAALASALGQTCGSVAATARTLSLLAQNEVGEVSERGRQGSGGSSSMPHKRNPIAAVLALAAARQAPGLVATLLTAMEQEHQRAAGSWHSEWLPLMELLRSTGSAVHWLRESLHRLVVHPDRMRENLVSAGHSPDPDGGTGSAGQFVSRALDTHRGRGGKEQS